MKALLGLTTVEGWQDWTWVLWWFQFPCSQSHELLRSGYLPESFWILEILLKGTLAHPKRGMYVPMLASVAFTWWRLSSCSEDIFTCPIHHHSRFDFDSIFCAALLFLCLIPCSLKILPRRYPTISTASTLNWVLDGTEQKIHLPSVFDRMLPLTCDLSKTMPRLDPTTSIRACSWYWTTRISAPH